MAQAYVVLSRAHRRTSILTQDAIASDGTRIQVKQAGPMVSYAPGDVIEDIRLDELEAFPDRFRPATAAEVDAWHERQSQMPTVLRAPGLNPAQALEHADLTRQIQELEAKQQALLTEAQTPVPVDVERPEETTPRPAAGSRTPPQAPRTASSAASTPAADAAKP